jgi:PHD/YefM family antitoxin component YafN of YafNO toxin-antitoxin module
LALLRVRLIAAVSESPQANSAKCRPLSVPAEQSPVAITKDGRLHTVLMSAAHFELNTNGRIARSIKDADDEPIRATLDRLWIAAKRSYDI